MLCPLPPHLPSAVAIEADEEVVMVLFQDEPLLANVGCAVVRGIVCVDTDVLVPVLEAGIEVESAAMYPDAVLEVEVEVEAERVVGDEVEADVEVAKTVVDVEVDDEMMVVVELRPVGVARGVAETLIVAEPSTTVTVEGDAVAVALPNDPLPSRETVTVLSTTSALVLLTTIVANAVAVCVLTTCVTSGA